MIYITVSENIIIYGLIDDSIANVILKTRQLKMRKTNEIKLFLTFQSSFRYVFLAEYCESFLRQRPNLS